ncbi:MAG: flagellar basal body P-ring formation chaperone FlgA [Nannocystaceae bacterium]|nr:flagellar basal body P-ring formation chaperone FlgA [bacterium]
MMFRALLLSALICLGGPKPGDEPTDPFAETREEVQRTIVEQLEPDLPTNLLIGEVSVPATFVPGEDDEVRAKWRRVPKEGNAFALVELERNGLVQRRAFVRIKLVAVHEVLVAQRELAEGDVISEGDIALEPRIGDDGIALSPVSLVGSTVLEDVEFGQLMNAANLELPPPVARGSSVKVVVRVGGARIESHGRLEVTARPGEQVRVRVRATRKVVKGLLVNAKTVEMESEGA